MGISTELQYASMHDLYLDPMNPRLGRHIVGEEISQENILEIMRTWTLEELALSYLESGGFWTHEALLVVKEEIYGRRGLVVVEGNRRLAALKYLYNTYQGMPPSRKWETIIQNIEPPEGLFEKVPYLIVDSREDVLSFLGFRHVTGIKQWDADEKAGFIARLIDEQGMTYEEVMRRIGSKTPTVRNLYIAYRLLLQIEARIEKFDPKWAENRFAVLYMSISTEGVKDYLQIDVMAEPEFVRVPVSDERLQHLANFSRWLFGTDDLSPLVTDTRDVSKFGRILESREAVEYLENRDNPRFQVALQIAGGDEPEIARYLREAADNVELSLSRVHFYRDSEEIKAEVERLGSDVFQLLKIFPDIHPR